MARRIAHCLVRGRVQGVGFRWFVRRCALENRVRGWCANLPDGRVEVLAEGDGEGIDTLIAALRRGPPASRVEEVIVEAGEPGDAEARSIAPDGARVPFDA